jgi:histone H1/5
MNPTKKKTILSVSPVKKKGKPTYVEMVHEALVVMGDRSGSSGIAISKWLMAHHDHLTKLTPGKFKHSMSLALKTCVKSGRFVKVKASYKVNPEWVKKERQATRAKEAMRKAKERKRQVELQKVRDKKNKMSEEDRKKQAKLKAEEAARQKKERAAEEEKKRVLNMTDEEKAVLAEKVRLTWKSESFECCPCGESLS